MALRRENTEKNKPWTSSRLSYSFMNFMNKHDKFGKEIPNFSLKGSSKITSNLGSALTLISGIVILIYAASKT